jgi:ABC-type branched-subunit amino acid transport system ATPase component
MAFLELTELTKTFGRVTAVDAVDLSIERGEFLTLLGPGGCGKTTILRMVAGFETPSAGTILLRTFLGPFTRFHVQVNDETTLAADVPSQYARELYVAEPVVLSFAADACQVLPTDGSIKEAEKITESEKV